MNKKSFYDALVVLVVGLIILGVAYQYSCFKLNSCLKLSWSDEIIYAVTARNIVEGRGIITNFYVPEAIITAGYPLGDVHMPGYMMLLAIFFQVFGVKENTVFLLNQFSYLLTGLLLYYLGKQIFNRQAGFSAAVLFFLFPTVVTYAHSGMAELTLILLSALYLIVWHQSYVNSRLIFSFLLAVLLVAGMIHRETFVVLLPVTVYTLWIFYPHQRKKAVLFFLLTFFTLVALAFIPLYYARAPYPHAFSEFLALPDTTAQIWFIIENFKTNLIIFLGWPRFSYVHWNFLLLFLVGLLCWFRKDCLSILQKQLLIVFLSGFTALFLGVAVLYSFIDWRGTRLLLMMLPAGILILSGFVCQWKSLLARYAFLLLVILNFSYGSFYIHHELSLHRYHKYMVQQKKSQIIISQTAHIQPQIVLSNKAFLYGWQNYPVVVIWRVPTELTTAQRLERIITPDVIVVDEKGKNRLLDAVRHDMLTTDYQLVSEFPVDGQYFFVNVERLAQ